ncbi:hypothetical protein [Longitalea luteola]|uniref:hypothetical protein n=1 Tax=Longitalea luteola TaxID=2812563 RepID=UPI001A96A5E7|nr:hypothetical protein [Longitalea luteola]
MATFRFKTSLVLFLLGFLVGFCTSQLFARCNPNPPANKSAVAPVKELELRAKSEQTIFLNKISALQKSNEQLNEKLRSTQSELQKAKQVTANKERSIKQLVKHNGYDSKNLIERRAKEYPADTGIASQCDSLITEVNAYLDENQRKDSLYEQQLEILGDALDIKDSVIKTHQSVYYSLATLFDQSVEQKQMLQSENLKMRKWMKRQKRKNKLLTLGAIALAGFAASSILH